MAIPEPHGDVQERQLSRNVGQKACALGELLNRLAVTPLILLANPSSAYVVRHLQFCNSDAEARFVYSAPASPRWEGETALT